MTERSILFNGAMVRALLDGSKTQTRRVIKPDWLRCLDPEFRPEDMRQAVDGCPYGVPGDRLRVAPGEGLTFATPITIEVTDVRVERVADISPEDAKAEGAAYRITPGGDLSGAFEGCGPINYPAHFRDLWDSINGSTPGRSWDDNPWVWVVGFKVVTP